VGLETLLRYCVSNNFSFNFSFNFSLLLQISLPRLTARLTLDKSILKIFPTSLHEYPISLTAKYEITARVLLIFFLRLEERRSVQPRDNYPIHLNLPQALLLMDLGGYILSFKEIHTIFIISKCLSAFNSPSYYVV
jgi:hypothetical protein